MFPILQHSRPSSPNDLTRVPLSTHLQQLEIKLTSLRMDAKFMKSLFNENELRQAEDQFKKLLAQFPEECSAKEREIQNLQSIFQEIYTVRNPTTSSLPPTTFSAPIPWDTGLVTTPFSPRLPEAPLPDSHEKITGFYKQIGDFKFQVTLGGAPQAIALLTNYLKLTDTLNQSLGELGQDREILKNEHMKVSLYLFTKLISFQINDPELNVNLQRVSTHFFNESFPKFSLKLSELENQFRLLKLDISDSIRLQAIPLGLHKVKEYLDSLQSLAEYIGEPYQTRYQSEVEKLQSLETQFLQYSNNKQLPTQSTFEFLGSNITDVLCEIQFFRSYLNFVSSPYIQSEIHKTLEHFQTFQKYFDLFHSELSSPHLKIIQTKVNEFQEIHTQLNDSSLHVSQSRLLLDLKGQFFQLEEHHPAYLNFACTLASIEMVREHCEDPRVQNELHDLQSRFQKCLANACSSKKYVESISDPTVLPLYQKVERLETTTRSLWADIHEVSFKQIKDIKSSAEGYQASLKQLRENLHQLKNAILQTSLGPIHEYALKYRWDQLESKVANTWNQYAKLIRLEE